MPLYPSWPDIILRLVLTVIAGGLIGFNRTEYGRPAGLRTTILVCLAASIAMLQANLLLPTMNKSPDSFAVMDVMRLPLGILTGMGFIGAGAILRRGDHIQGVTTAATLWLVTVIGLCFGGGQLWLGGTGTVLAMLVLWALHRFEIHLSQDRRGTLLIAAAASGPDDSDLRARLKTGGYTVLACGVTYEGPEGNQLATLRYELRWSGSRENEKTPPIVKELASTRGVERVRWKQ